MSDHTAIEWTDATWNPVTGCTKVSQGCKHCYAKTIHDQRHKAHLAGKRVPPQYASPFERVIYHPERIDMPRRWLSPRKIFVNSMSDLFHPDVPFQFIDEVMNTIRISERHTFQILTKRPERMYEYFTTPNHFRAEKISNLWLGVSVEDQAAADQRIPLLLKTPAAVRFLSCEPLLAPLDLSRYLACQWVSETKPTKAKGIGLPPMSDYARVQPRIDWVIVGGESGKDARPMRPNWVQSIRDQCQAAVVPFFFKQWGQWLHRSQVSEMMQGELAMMEIFGRNFRYYDEDKTLIRLGKKYAGNMLDGRQWHEFPLTPTPYSCQRGQG